MVVVAQDKDKAKELRQNKESDKQASVVQCEQGKGDQGTKPEGRRGGGRRGKGRRWAAAEANMDVSYQDKNELESVVEEGGGDMEASQTTAGT